jgi:hypothetical protein
LLGLSEHYVGYRWLIADSTLSIHIFRQHRRPTPFGVFGNVGFFIRLDFANNEKRELIGSDFLQDFRQASS